MSTKKSQNDEVLKVMNGLNPPSGNAGHFKPGHPRYGGRKKGSPAKRTQEAREIAERLGFHPIELLAIIAMRGVIPNADGTETPVDTDARLDAIKAAAPYLTPRLSAQQITGKDEGPLAVSTLDVAQILANPALARMAQDLALAMAEQERASVPHSPNYNLLLPSPAGVDRDGKATE